MISKNKIKFIHSLETKKGRRQEGLFVAEGFKVVGDLLKAGFQAKTLVATDEWLNSNSPTLPDCEIIAVSDEELRKVSFLQHPQQVLAVFPLPEIFEISKSRNLENIKELTTLARHELILALDGIQDPGNLGTIIRIADWFGIRTILCSRDTADAFAPKVVQATMGSIARVKVIYTDLAQTLANLASENASLASGNANDATAIPIYGTLLDGENIYQTGLQPHGIIVMGNEGNGLSPAVRQLVTHRLLIPSYPPDSKTSLAKSRSAESLNVAIATAITCAEFRRRTEKTFPKQTD